MWANCVKLVALLALISPCSVAGINHFRAIAREVILLVLNLGSVLFQGQPESACYAREDRFPFRRFRGFRCRGLGFHIDGPESETHAPRCLGTCHPVHMMSTALFIPNLKSTWAAETIIKHSIHKIVKVLHLVDCIVLQPSTYSHTKQTDPSIPATIIF